MRAWAGSCLLTSPLEEKVCASREEDDLGTRMRAAAPLQVKLAGEGEGSARVELSLPALVFDTHKPGWDVAKSYFPGRQTWGAKDNSG